jgi:hypothetical protein
MVVDVGGGTSEVAVISLGGSSCRVAARRRLRPRRGDHATTSAASTGWRSARRAPRRSSSRSARRAAREEELETSIRGRDLLSGLPRELVLTSEEVREALAEPLPRSWPRSTTRSRRRRPSSPPTSPARASCWPAAARCCAASPSARRRAPGNAVGRETREALEALQRELGLRAEDAAPAIREPVIPQFELQSRDVAPDHAAPKRPRSEPGTSQRTERGQRPVRDDARCGQAHAPLKRADGCGRQGATKTVDPAVVKALDRERRLQPGDIGIRLRCIRGRTARGAGDRYGCDDESKQSSPHARPLRRGRPASFNLCASERPQSSG